MPYKDVEVGRQWKREKIRKHRKFIQRVKTLKGCQICGFKEHYSALGFDHIDPATKDPKLQNHGALNETWGMARIKDEMRKCRVLCANCHAMESHRQGHHNIR